MKNRRLVLLNTLLKSTGTANYIKYSKDTKKKKQVIGNKIGFSTLYLLLLAYCVLMSIGYGQAGLIEAIPTTAALTISLLGFVFTLLKTNGYLFAFKEYDMLMAMPLSVRTIVADKFLYMYIKSIPMMVCISVSMMIGYGIYAKPSVLTYIIWILLSFVIPMIPMVIASALGALFAKIGSGFKHKKLVQTILIFIFILACVFSRFIIEAIFKEGRTEEVVGNIAETMEKTSGYYPPAKWFTAAVTGHGILYAVIMIAVSVGVLELFVALTAGSYRKINSALTTGTAHKDYHVGGMKKRSKVGTVAFKELKRFLGSTTYVTNAGFGEVMVVILAIAAIFVDADTLIAKVLQGAPLTKEMLLPAVPLIIYFMLGMISTPACSLSLEGKNNWIVQSMPIEKIDLYRGKMRFNLWLTMPFMIFASVTLGISAKASLLHILLLIVCGTALLMFSTCYGMVCGIKHVRYDWENEMEVIKQGTAVTVYLLPNMLVTMALMAGVVVLGLKLGTTSVLCILTAAAAILAYICYCRVKRLAAK